MSVLRERHRRLRRPSRPRVRGDYAAGAYVAGWFARCSSGAVPSRPSLLGLAARGPRAWAIHLRAARDPAGGLSRALLGVRHRPAHAAPARHYLAIVTLGFGEIVPQVVRNGDHSSATTSRTARTGSRGSTGSASASVHSAASFLPPSYSSRSTPTTATTGQLSRSSRSRSSAGSGLRDSRLGRWVAIREDEIAAAAMGIPLTRARTWACVLGRLLRWHRRRPLRASSSWAPRSSRRTSRLPGVSIGTGPVHGGTRRDQGSSGVCLLARSSSRLVRAVPRALGSTADRLGWR